MNFQFQYLVVCHATLSKLSYDFVQFGPKIVQNCPNCTVANIDRIILVHASSSSFYSKQIAIHSNLLRSKINDIN